MLHKSFFISLLCVMTLAFSSCGGSGSKNELWNMLSGIWRLNEPMDLGSNNIFYFFGFDDDQKPICFPVWYYEMGEIEYVTEVEKLNDSSFRVTLEVPANDEEDGLHEVHEAYTIIRDFDVSRYSEGVFTMSTPGSITVWTFAGKTFDELTYID